MNEPEYNNYFVRVKTPNSGYFSGYPKSMTEEEAEEKIAKILGAVSEGLGFFITAIDGSLVGFGQELAANSVVELVLVIDPDPMYNDERGVHGSLGDPD